MQCKDIPTKPILDFLNSLDGKWANWFIGHERSVQAAFPEEARETKLVLAKMRQLIKNGLVSGCACGCRGDFEITQKGIETLNSN